MSLLAVKLLSRTGSRTLRLAPHTFRMASTDDGGSSKGEPCPDPKNPCPEPPKESPPKQSPPKQSPPKQSPPKQSPTKTECSAPPPPSPPPTPCFEPPPCPTMPQCPPTICPPMKDPTNPCNYCPPPCIDPDYPDLTKLKKLQCKFQENNGIPVFLKNGKFDVFLYQLTLVLTLIGASASLCAMVELAFKM